MTTLSQENQDRETIRASIRQGATFDRAHLLMNILAATIASYGLFVNSPAVVIGAMIIGMLMGSIAGVALALVDSDMKFLLKSLSSLLAGVTGVIATAFILGTIHKEMPLTSGILALTAPNLLDLMIALAGGAAGAYATVSPRLSISFIGVAVTTALVPPLSSAGILLARGEINLALGALLLAFTNMVAIQFAFSIVLGLSGFRRVIRISGHSVSTFVEQNIVSIIILLVLAVVLTSSLQRVVARQIYETTTRFTLQQEINRSLGSHLVEVQFETLPGTTIVRAVVRGPNPPSGAQVAALEALLPSPPDGTQGELRVRFVQTEIINRDGPLHENNAFGTSE
jgi:uncharacterized hydrophobic protein (TIGR00271 family)